MPRALDNLLQRLQKSRMHVTVDGGDARVVPIDSEQILGQVVGADRDEIHAFGDSSTLVDRCRHLDHDTGFGHGDGIALADEFPVGSPDQGCQLLDFIHGTDHRHHDVQVSETRVGAQHGAYLGQENLGMVE